MCTVVGASGGVRSVAYKCIAGGASPEDVLVHGGGVSDLFLHSHRHRGLGWMLTQFVGYSGLPVEITFLLIIRVKLVISLRFPKTHIQELVGQPAGSEAPISIREPLSLTWHQNVVTSHRFTHIQVGFFLWISNIYFPKVTWFYLIIHRIDNMCIIKY